MGRRGHRRSAGVTRRQTERAPERKQIKPLEGGRLKTLRSSEADYGTVFGAMLSNDRAFEDLLEPGFWSNHAGKMHIGDTIEASLARCHTATGSPPWPGLSLPKEKRSPRRFDRPIFPPPCRHSPDSGDGRTRWQADGGCRRRDR
jgi:hypothetical protein